MGTNRGQQVFVTDCETTELDDSCGMKLWYARLEEGGGIQRKDTLLPELLRQEVHADFRAISKLEDLAPTTIQALIDEILAHLTFSDQQDQGKMELLYRRLGWLAAYALFIEPDIRENYTDIEISSAIAFDKDPLWVIVQPDRVLQDQQTNETVYREYALMPAGVPGRTWLQGWLYRMQIHVGIAAAEAELKREITYGQMMGLSEGFRSTLDGRLIHPYVWGYFNRNQEEWAYSFKAEAEGWKPTPVWEFPGGIVAWVRMCGKPVADGQFPLSPLIQLNQRMLDSWVARRIHREREIHQMQDVARKNKFLRGIHFEQRTGECRPGNGDACPFLPACWGQESPLKSGEFISRESPVVDGGITT